MDKNSKVVKDYTRSTNQMFTIYTKYKNIVIDKSPRKIK